MDVSNAVMSLLLGYVCLSVGGYGPHLIQSMSSVESSYQKLLDLFRRLATIHQRDT